MMFYGKVLCDCVSRRGFLREYLNCPLALLELFWYNEGKGANKMNESTSIPAKDESEGDYQRANNTWRMTLKQYNNEVYIVRLKYDNEEESVILFNNCKCYYQHCKSKEERKQFIKDKKEKWKGEFEFEKLKPAVWDSWQRLRLAYKDAKEQLDDDSIMAEALTELHKMLTSCGEDYKTMGEVAKLWCGILAGHITQLLAKKVSKYGTKRTCIYHSL